MIRVEKISKSFSGKTVLGQVTYHFPKGQKIALVGANGQGKTTFLNMLSGLDVADSGHLIKPKEMTLAFLPQSPNPHPLPTLLAECIAGHKVLCDLKVKMETLLGEMEKNYSEELYADYDTCLTTYQNLGGYQLEGQAEKALLGLGFKEEQLSQCPLALSGGWRMRLELAKTLISGPDFLILDEPTNHLDIPSIEWLEDYLSAFRGTVLFVSHDRAFLNALATVTLYLNQGKLQEFIGNFDAFLEQKNQQGESNLAAREKIVRQQTHMQKFVDRFKAKASKARQAQSRVKMIQRLEEVLSGVEGAETSQRVQFPKLEIPPSGKEVLRLEKVDVGYKTPLLKNISLTIQRGQRIGIIGVNGVGKSTLLKTLSAELPVLRGTLTMGSHVSLGFYTQQAAELLEGHRSVFECLQDQNPDLSDSMRRALLGMFLFKKNDLSKPVKVLSGGERARLALCGILSRRPNFFLLDEPTNHLDMMTSEILAEMLNQYAGTVVFVSHDRSFVEQVATSLIQIEAGGQVIG